MLKCRTRIALRTSSRVAHLLQEWGGALSIAHVANPPWRTYTVRMNSNRFRHDGQHWQSSGDRLGCNTLTEWGLPGAGAFGFTPENGWAWDACGVCGNVPEFRGGWLVSGRIEEQRRSVQVIVQNRVLAERLLDPAYLSPAQLVRDMRKSSVFKHGRFPDTRCYTYG